jgi:hypothetical protein
MAGGDVASLPQRKPETVVNIAHSRKFNGFHQPRTQPRFFPLGDHFSAGMRS